MLAADWVELLNKIPLADHEKLLVTTNNGTEIAISRIMQIGAEYVLVKGRLGGTTDTGRVFCLPYDRLMYLGFLQALSDERLTEIFGQLLRPVKESGPLELQAEEKPAQEAVSKPDGSAAPEKHGASTAALRERLRARVAAQTPEQPKAKAQLIS